MIPTTRASETEEDEVDEDPFQMTDEELEDKLKEF